MRRFYLGLGVVTGIAGVASIIYGLTQGRHGSSAITSGIILLVVAASTVYARRGSREETIGEAGTTSTTESVGISGAQGLAPRQVYVVMGLTVVFAVIGFAIADAIGAPTTGPGPPGVIVFIGCVVACSVYALARSVRAHRTHDHPRTR